MAVSFPAIAEFVGSIGGAEAAADVGATAMTGMDLAADGGMAAMDIGAAETAAGLGMSGMDMAADISGGVGLGGDVASAAGGGIMGPTATSGEISGGMGQGSSFYDKLGSLFGGKGGGGMGMAKLFSSLYGISQSQKIGKLATQPNKAGEQAVQRSMAAQGYQGSGNMMAALNQYGINGSQAAVPGATAGLQGTMSSLGLLTSGIGDLFGWGKG